MALVRGEPFIVFHDAYRYFEDRFGLTAVGSAVVSEERSPGVRRIRELCEKIRQPGAACVFSEPHFDQRLVATIIEGTAIRSGTVDPLGVNLENGPNLYFAMLRNMAAAFSNFGPRAGGLAEQRTSLRDRFRQQAVSGAEPILEPAHASLDFSTPFAAGSQSLPLTVNEWAMPLSKG